MLISGWGRSMPLMARRVFRLSFTMAFSLAGAYAMQLPLPFLAPIFALMLGAKPSSPPGLKGLIGLILIVLCTLSVGLLLTPMLVYYPVSAVLIITLGVYFSTYITVGKGKMLIGMLLTIGITLITAAGTVEHALAVTVIQALALGVGLAIICQWLVYPWFPENEGVTEEVEDEENDMAPEESAWIALRATLIIMPAYLLTLTNPAMYLPIIMKTVNLGQQSSVLNARDAGTELLGSTLTGGVLAILFWFVLDLVTNLWMFSLCMLLFGIFIASKLYGVLSSRFSGAYWQNTGVTMLILLGPAVEDSASGKDVYTAFLVRMALFIVVTLYAWLTIVILEQWRVRRQNRFNQLELNIGKN